MLQCLMARSSLEPISPTQIIPSHDLTDNFQLHSMHPTSPPVICPLKSGRKTTRMKMGNHESYSSQLTYLDVVKRESRVSAPQLETDPESIVIDQHTLNAYFREREAKPEFYASTFFSNRNQLLPTSNSRRAQNIFLRGAVWHVKSIQEEATFSKGWQPRQFNDQLKVTSKDNGSYRLAINHLNRGNRPQETIDANFRREIGCQVSSQSLLSSPNLFRCNYLNEIEHLVSQNTPIITKRDSSLNPMVSMRNNEKVAMFIQREAPIAKISKPKKPQKLQQQSVKFLLSGGTLPFEYPKNTQMNSKVVEADIFQQSISVSQRRIKQYYKKLNGY